MDLKVYEDSKNYTCQVVKLKNIRKHPNADRLMIATVQGNNVICGLDSNENDLYLYFPLESQLSIEFATKNDLIRRKDENGNPAGGMFEEKRRVRCVKLRGEKSEGFVCSLKSLENVGIKNYILLENGQEFNEIDGIEICRKYVVRNNQTEAKEKGDKKKVKRISRLVPDQVRLHVDTEQLKKNIHQLNLDDYISIHYKKHGTSWWAGNLLTKKKLNWKERILKKLGVNIEDKEYSIVYGSRRVVKNEFETRDAGHYFGYDIWADIKDEVKDIIPKGYTLYGEAIGYTKDDAYIQKGYDYGCKVGEHKTYIYRITITNPDGKVIDLDDNQIKEFCNKYGLNYNDTFFYYGTPKELFSILNIKHKKHLNPDLSKEEWREQFLELLILEYTEKNCYMCVNRVPEEGIVLRKQGLFEYEAFKLKSFRFLEAETKSLDKGEVDMESEQSII